ncbi:MAG: hypothetical protein ACOX4H_09035 [Bacillota bacterium]|jgi:hypothetical protein|nr:hypothetical protein [Clostridia bacterium]
MKKVKVLVGIFTLALMLMGLGYAAWNDQVEVTATAKTGILDVTLTSASIRDGAYYGDLQAEPDTDFRLSHAFTRGTVDYPYTDDVGVYNSGDGLVVTLGNLYPGSTIRLDAKGINNSTLAVIPGGMEVEFIDGNYALFEAIKAKVEIQKIGGPKFTIQDSSFGRLTNVGENFDRMKSQIQDRTTGLVLNPGDEFAFGTEDDPDEDCFIFVVPKNLGNEFMNEFCKFKIKINWVQWNDAA